MSSSCRLCKKNDILRNSHIIPKFFYEELKKLSLTKTMRNGINVNKPQQDGIKTKFLCQDCEVLFSKYEKYFSEKIYNHYIDKDILYTLNSDNDELRYFILSFVWRYIKYYLEQNKTSSESYPLEITPLEMEKLENLLNDWRLNLLQEDHKAIKNYGMFIIPYDNINTTDDNLHDFFNMNSVAPDFSFFDKEDTFECSLFFLKVPHLIFIFTIWGHYNSLKSNKVGKTIKIKDTKFDKIFLSYVEKILNNFKKSKQNLSDKQMQATIKRVLKAKNNSTKNQ